MAAAPEYIAKLVQFLNQESSWNVSILQDISDFLKVQNPTNKDIDILLMSTTKRVETCLREKLAAFIARV